MKYNFLLLICALGGVFAGCNVIDPAEKVPSYIQIDSVKFNNTDPLKEGTAHQKIQVAWVFIDNQPAGVFDLPARIPIIPQGSATQGVVQVIPGVVTSGLNDYHTQYPFFKSDTATIIYKPGEVTHYDAKTTYVNDAKFQWKEDFETGNTFINVNSDIPGDTSVVRTTDQGKVFEGAGSGYIYMDATHPTSENITNNGYPITAGRSFLELNYKCNTSFQVGVQATVSGGIIELRYIAGVKARESWNKIYIDLSQFTSEFKSPQYRITIKTGLDEGLSTGYVLLDNMKVISF